MLSLVPEELDWRKTMKPNEAKSRLLGVEQAAERLGVKPATIRSWILRRQKLEVVKVGRLVRITEKSIDEFINENTIPPRKVL
jgi:excisionase family DNA binding protein